MTPKYGQKFSDLLIRFAQVRCPVSDKEPAGGSRVRTRFYNKCYLYRDRFSKTPEEDMLEVIWIQAQND